jgi:uncharacterized membrane protein HdeD (DUF308 family)
MLETIRKYQRLYIIESVLFILLGLAALFMPFIFSLSLELLLGCLFLIAGTIQGVRTLKAGWSDPSFLPSLILSLVAFSLGFYLLRYPLYGIISLTFLLAVYFFVDGIVKVLIALLSRDVPFWGLLLFGGILSIFIGYFIWSQIPANAFWILGVLIGVNLLYWGLTTLMITLTVKK